jgi:hypothetical protein
MLMAQLGEAGNSRKKRRKYGILKKKIILSFFKVKTAQVWI